MKKREDKELQFTVTSDSTRVVVTYCAGDDGTLDVSLTLTKREALNLISVMTGILAEMS